MSLVNESRKEFQSRLPQPPTLLPPDAGPVSPGCSWAASAECRLFSCMPMVVDNPGNDSWLREEVSPALSL